MKEITFFTAKLTLKSPLMIGSGESEYSQRDILRTKEGKPYIPGTSIAGVCRAFFDGDRVANVDELFGTVGENEKYTESRFVFYNAYMADKNAKPNITVRDGVKIEDNFNQMPEDLTVNRNKYDYEILEPGVTFILRIELRGIEKEKAIECFQKILYGINQRLIRIGAKTSRGFGILHCDNPKILSLCIPKDVQKLIDFDWSKFLESESSIALEVTQEKLDSLKNTQYEKITTDLEIKYFLMIRNYGTKTKHVIHNADTEGSVTEKYNDASFLSSKRKKENEDNTEVQDVPVIPGTTWAGAFRHHFLKILQIAKYPDPEGLTNEVFGYVDLEENKKQASNIIFEESEITDYKTMNRTRTAIDRFTGSSCNKMLFTNNPIFGGKVKLTIWLRNTIKNYDVVRSAINVCMKDLKEGYLPVGGEKSIGAGIFMEAGGKSSGNENE